jgi:hypothetical protein
MNIRARTEQQILKTIESMNLSEALLASPESMGESNRIMAEILNHKSRLNAIQKASESCLILRVKAA